MVDRQSLVLSTLGKVDLFRIVDVEVDDQTTYKSDRILLLCNHDGHLDLLVVLYYLITKLPKHRPVFVYHKEWSRQTLFGRLAPGLVRQYLEALHIPLVETDIRSTLTELRNQGQPYVVVVFPEDQPDVSRPEGPLSPGTYEMLQEPQSRTLVSILGVSRAVEQVIGLDILFPDNLYRDRHHRSWKDLLDGVLCNFALARATDVTAYFEGRSPAQEMVKEQLARHWEQKKAFMYMTARAIKTPCDVHLTVPRGSPSVRRDATNRSGYLMHLVFLVYPVICITRQPTTVCRYLLCYSLADFQHRNSVENAITKCLVLLLLIYLRQTLMLYVSIAVYMAEKAVHPLLTRNKTLTDIVRISLYATSLALLIADQPSG